MGVSPLKPLRILSRTPVVRQYDACLSHAGDTAGIDGYYLRHDTSGQGWTMMKRSVPAVLSVLIFASCGGGGGSGGGGGGGGGGGSNPPPVSAASGLDQRPSNLSCVAPARVTGNSTLSLQRAFPNLTFLEPVAMLQAPGDNSRWFVIEQNGIVRVFANEQSVQTSQVFLDISSRVFQLSQTEAGMLGLAFHPGWPSTNRAYINYTGRPLRSITAEFTSPDGGLTLDPNSERPLLTVNKPYDNHNGGQLAFGPSD